MENSLDYEVISRWETTGLLDNLPLFEKEELAIIYDNTIRLVLSDKSLSKIPKDINDMFNTVNLPIIRRLYRRVGPFFNLDELLGKLLVEVQEKINYLSEEKTSPEDPIVDFCKIFADNYEDEKTLSKKISKEEYIIEVNDIISNLKDILLNDKMVSNVNKNDGDWVIVLSDKLKSEHVTRFWNQKIAYSFLTQSLSDLNKK